MVLVTDMANNIKTKQIALSEIFYLCFIVLMLFAKGIGLYDGQLSYKLFLIVAVFFYVLKMLMTSYSIWEFTIITFFLLIGGLSYFISGEKGILIYIFMVTGMTNVPLKRIFNVAFITWIISFGGMFLLTVTHILESPFKIHDKFGAGYLIRWGLGHSHPNVLHISYLTLVMLSIYLLNKHFDLKWFIILLFGNIYVFLYSLSSTGFISVCFLLSFNLYWYYRKRFNIAENVLVSAILPICLILSMLVPVILTGQAFDIVNKIVNTRLRLSRHFLLENPISLFGTRSSNITNQWYTMDNSYIYLYVLHGIILFSVIMIAYFVIIRRYLKTEKGMELSIILTTLVTGITEPFMFNTSFKNLSLFFFGELIFEDKKTIYFLPVKIRAVTITLLDYGFLLQSKAIKIKKVYQSKRRRIWLFTGAIMLITGFMFGVFQNPPDAFIAPRNQTDASKLEAVYLDSLSEMEGLNIKILGCIDNTTEIVVFSGNIVILEWIRGIVTGMLLVGFASFCCIISIIFKKSGQ